MRIIIFITLIFFASPVSSQEITLSKCYPDTWDFIKKIGNKGSTFITNLNTKAVLEISEPSGQSQAYVIKTFSNDYAEASSEKNPRFSNMGSATWADWSIIKIDFQKQDVEIKIYSKLISKNNKQITNSQPSTSGVVFKYLCGYKKVVG
jgi:hypothetical protein